MKRGRLVAAALAGAWRHSPSPPDLSRRELAAVAPLLLRSGGGALGWWRVRDSDLRPCRAARELQQAYRLHSLQASLHDRQIAEVFTLLRACGVEPLLAKGWAVARLYPEPGLRPYGDVDVLVRPEQHAAAVAALTDHPAQRAVVDLHREFSGLQDRTVDELYVRSRVVSLGEVDVRILGPEDHLRLLCEHMLLHGAWRPLWLCDMGVALESRPPHFDWSYFLSGNSSRSDRVACALGLAERLLGARLNETPIAERARHLPTWLIPAVLREWGREHRYRRPIVTYLRRPAGMLDALRRSWPNPVLATAEVGGPFNEWPRLPFQLAQCLARTARIAAELAGPGERSRAAGTRIDAERGQHFPPASESSSAH